MKTENKRSKAQKNYLVDISAFVPMFLLIFSGIVLLKYHGGAEDTEKAMNLTGFFWRNAHAIVSLLSVTIIGVHLAQHLNWFKTLFSKAKRHKKWGRNLTLVILFTLATITGLIPWLFMGDAPSAKLMLGIHNKFGLLLIIFMIVHLMSYAKWLINMTKKAFSSSK